MKCCTWTPPRGWRGGQNQVLLTAQGMAARGHAVALACRAGGALEARARAAGPRRARPAASRGDLSPRGRRRPGPAPAADAARRRPAPRSRTRWPRASWPRAPRRRARIVATRRVDFRAARPRSRAGSTGRCDRVIAVSRKIAACWARDGVPRGPDPRRLRGRARPPALPGGPRGPGELGVPGRRPGGRQRRRADRTTRTTRRCSRRRRACGERVPEARFVIVGEGELRAAAGGAVPRARPARPLDLRRASARPRPAAPRLHGLLPVVPHGGPRHQPARRHGLRAARWWPPPRAASPRRSRTGSPAAWCPSRDPAALARALVGRARRSRARRAAMGAAGPPPLRGALHRRPHGGGAPSPSTTEPAVKVRAILNPRAGVAARAALDALRAGEPPWAELDVQLTDGPGRRAAAGARGGGGGLDVVLAVGGDGTANEAAWGLLGSPHRARASSPPGSGNGLARALRHPAAPRGARCARSQDAVVRRMDVGMVNGAPVPERGRRRLRRAGGRGLPRVGTRAAAGAGSSTTSAWPSARAPLPRAQLEPRGGRRALRRARPSGRLRQRPAIRRRGRDRARARASTTACSTSW